MTQAILALERTPTDLMRCMCPPKFYSWSTIQKSLALRRQCRSVRQLSRGSPRIELWLTQNCVDITDNRTQYLVVVTLLLLEMGRRFWIQALRYEMQGKNSPGGISCQQRKRQRKRKRNINRKRGSFSRTEVLWPLERSTSRGVFSCSLNSDIRHEGANGEIWVVPQAE